MDSDDCYNEMSKNAIKNKAKSLNIKFDDLNFKKNYSKRVLCNRIIQYLYNIDRELIEEVDVDEMVNLESSTLRCEDIGGLKYCGDSCYMDSTLMALFFMNNDFWFKKVFSQNIREEEDE